MPYIEFEEFKDFTGKTDDFKAAGKVSQKQLLF